MQKKQDDDHHKHDCLEERDNHGVYALADKDCGVVHDRVIEARREICLHLLHRSADVRGQIQRIAARLLKDRKRNGRLVVQQRTQRKLPCSEFHPRDVLEQHFLPVRAGLDDDILELLLGDKATLRIDLQFKRDGSFQRLLPYCTGSHLHVLLPNRRHDIASGQTSRRDFVGIEPYAHRIITGTKDLDLPNAADTRQNILHLERGVVPHVDVVVSAIRREKMNHHR